MKARIVASHFWGSLHFWSWNGIEQRMARGGNDPSNGVWFAMNENSRSATWKERAIVVQFRPGGTEVAETE